MPEKFKTLLPVKSSLISLYVALTLPITFISSEQLKTPSLFYSIHKNEYIIISSEKLNNDMWYSIKNNSLIKASENKVEIEKI